MKGFLKSIEAEKSRNIAELWANSQSPRSDFPESLYDFFFFNTEAEWGLVCYDKFHKNIPNWCAHFYSLVWHMLNMNPENNQCESEHPMKVEPDKSLWSKN